MHCLTLTTFAGLRVHKFLIQATGEASLSCVQILASYLQKARDRRRCLYSLSRAYVVLAHTHKIILRKDCLSNKVREQIANAIIKITCAALLQYPVYLNKIRVVNCPLCVLSVMAPTWIKWYSARLENTWTFWNTSTDFTKETSPAQCSKELLFSFV